MLGNGASSWILHIWPFIIPRCQPICQQGNALKEWKGVSAKTRVTITLGIVTILFSVILVGYGNALK